MKFIPFLLLALFATAPLANGQEATEENVEYEINRYVSLYATADTEILLGDAADSPLVKDIGQELST